MGACPRQPVLRVGGADSRDGRCRSVATAEEVRVARGSLTGNVSEGDELTTTNAAQSNHEVGPRGRNGRLGETSGTSASGGWTAEDDSEVQCNLKTMNEQQRAMLQKSGKQLLMDIRIWPRLATWDKSELLSTCGLLGGRILRISRHTGCDLLTRGECQGSESAHRRVPDSLLVPSFVCSVVSVAIERQ